MHLEWNNYAIVQKVDVIFSTRAIAISLANAISFFLKTDEVPKKLLRSKKYKYNGKI